MGLATKILIIIYKCMHGYMQRPIHKGGGREGEGSEKGRGGGEGRERDGGGDGGRRMEGRMKGA